MSMVRLVGADFMGVGRNILCWCRLKRGFESGFEHYEIDNEGVVYKLFLFMRMLPSRVEVWDLLKKSSRIISALC